MMTSNALLRAIYYDDKPIRRILWAEWLEFTKFYQWAVY